MIYFVYGSLLSPAEMRLECAAARALCPACAIDHALAFPRWSDKRNCAVAGIVPAPGESAWGVLYEVDAAGERNLFRREGYDPALPDADNRYLMREIAVMRHDANGEARAARTFVANPDGTPHPPSGHYIGLMLAGARHHGLPADWIAHLEAIAVGP